METHLSLSTASGEDWLGMVYPQKGLSYSGSAKIGARTKKLEEQVFDRPECQTMDRTTVKPYGKAAISMPPRRLD